MLGQVLQYNQGTFPFPVREALEYLARLPESEFRDFLKDWVRRDSGKERRYLLLSFPEKLREDVLHLSVSVPDAAGFLGVDFDAPAQDLRRLSERVSSRIAKAVESLGDLRWLLDGEAETSGKVSRWELHTMSARLEPVRGLRRWTSTADGVLLLVREQRDTEFLSQMRARMTEHLEDPLERGLSPVEAENLVNHALSLSTSKKFLRFVSALAIERSRIGVMISMARSLLPVLEELARKNADKVYGAHYLRLILEMYDTVLQNPQNFHIESDFGGGEFVQELHKLKFFNHLPIWFVSQGTLSQEESGQALSELVSYSLRIGGENPKTGNLAVVDRILQAANEPKRAYLPAIVVYAMLFEPALKAPTMAERYEKVMQLRWVGLRNLWMEQRGGLWVLKAEVQNRIRDRLKRIREDIYAALQKTTENPLGEQVVRGNGSLTSDIVLSVDKALMSSEPEQGIVHDGGLPEESLQARWFRHIRVNDPNRHQDEEWFRMRVSTSLDARLLVREKDTQSITVDRKPVGAEKALRMQMFVAGEIGGDADRAFRRDMAQQRDAHLMVSVHLAEISKNRVSASALVWHFVQAWLIEKYVVAIVDRLREQGVSDLRLDMLRLQNGDRNDTPSNRMYGFCHLVEHRLAHHLPVFQQGIDVQSRSSATGRYRVDRTHAMASHVWPMRMGLPIEEPTALVHLVRFPEDEGKTLQAMARAFLAVPADGGFRYGHYRSWSRPSRDASHASLFAEGWLLSSVFGALQEAGVRRVVLVVSADAWMRSWMGEKRGALDELDAVYDVGHRILGKGAVVVPMAWRKHLLLMRKESKTSFPLVLDGIEALSGILSPIVPTESVEGSRLRIYASQGFATLRTVQNLSPQRGLMAYGFLYADTGKVREVSEKARQMALERYGWVHHVLLAHHAYVYEKTTTSAGNIVPMKNDPPIKLDPWSMENSIDRGCETLSVGSRNVMVDWLSLLTIFDLQTVSPQRFRIDGKSEDRVDDQPADD